MNVNQNTRKLTFLGVMLSLTIIFVMITAVPGASATMAFFMFIPTFVTSVIYGPKLGAVMGLLAGIATMARAYLAPLSPFDAFFLNPLVAILPRIFVGVTPYLVYKGLNKLNTSTTISAALAGATGAITNTVLVVFALYFVYGEQIIADYGVENSIIAFFIGIAGVNGIIEAASATVFTAPVVNIYNKVSKK